MGADPKEMGADPSELPFSIILRRSTSTGYPCQFEHSACFPTCFSGVPVRPHPGYPRIPQDTPGYHCEKPTDTPALHHPGTHPPRPIYDLALAYCESATFNETTQKPFSRQKINEVLTTDCYDETPERPWEFRFGAKRRPLTTEAKELRVGWGTRLQREGHTAAWFRDNILWMDICSKVIPGTPAVALDQARSAQNKKKRLMSPGSTDDSANLGGSETADKQCSWGSTRVYFGAVLTRGVFGIVVFTDVDEFPGETPEGARLLVEQLPALLNKMLGADAKKPRTIFTDRGPGFYHRRWGTVTGDYESACREQGFKLWVGPNSKQGPRAQPPDVADVVLHETAISWLRVEEEQTRPTRPWEETPKQLAVRLQRGVSRINKDFDVRGLCMEFPDRLHTLVKKKGGDRLPK